MTQPNVTKAKVEQEGALAVLRFEGDITSASRDAVIGSYENLPPEVTRILLDFTRVSYVNSSGIALIIQLLMDAGKTGRKVSVFGLTPHFQKVFTMVGLAKYTTFHADETAARANVNS